MPCAVNEHIAICRPTLDGWQRFFVKCFNCKRKRLALGEFQDWYGWRVICLTCGDSWMDGEIAERPFERGWRQKAVASAKSRIQHYVRAGIPQGLDAYMKRLEIELSESRTSNSQSDKPDKE